MTSLWRHSRLTYYNLGPNFLTQGVKLLPREVWQVSKRNSQYFRSYLRKTTGWPFGPPPSGARVAQRGVASFKAKFPVLQELFAKNHRGESALWKFQTSISSTLRPPPAGRGLREPRLKFRTVDDSLGKMMCTETLYSNEAICMLRLSFWCKWYMDIGKLAQSRDRVETQLKVKNYRHSLIKQSHWLQPQNHYRHADDIHT